MMRAAWLWLGMGAALIAATPLRSGGTPACTDRQAEPPAVELFNGKDLTGWEHLGGGRAWVADGRLILENDDRRVAGYLLADHPPIRDFVVTLECSIPIGDSGFFFRSERHPLHATEVQGPQVQLNLAPGRGLGGLFEHHGRGWLHRPPRALTDELARMEPPLRIELRAVGSRIQVKVNGKATVDIVDGDAENHFLRPGRFALQIHGGGRLRAEFSQIILRPLAP